MDRSEAEEVPCLLGDEVAKDVTVCLRTTSGCFKLFLYNSSDLIGKSKFFADHISFPSTRRRIEIYCLDSDFGHHVDVLNLLHHPVQTLPDSLKSVKYALNILKVAVILQCDEITRSCVQYLEATPWTDEEEEDITKIVPKLGAVAMPILARTLPVDLNATRNVLIAAVQLATSISRPCPPFGDELKVSAQEQIEYMLVEDDETQPLVSDETLRSVIKAGLSNVFSLFQYSISSLHSEPDLTSGTSETTALQNLEDLGWLCNILPMFSLMRDFVSGWLEISANILCVLDDPRFESTLWALKIRIIEISAKVLEVVGYGNVIIPPSARVQLLRTWMPFIRKTKGILDSMCSKAQGFTHMLDEELCQNMEGAMVSLILALPSSDQADILGDWMESEQLKFPDLSEAFDIWCYRAKSAERRLAKGLDREGSTSVMSDICLIQSPNTIDELKISDGNLGYADRKIDQHDV